MPTEAIGKSNDHLPTTPTKIFMVRYVEPLRLIVALSIRSSTCMTGFSVHPRSCAESVFREKVGGFCSLSYALWSHHEHLQQNHESQRRRWRERRSGQCMQKTKESNSTMQELYRETMFDEEKIIEPPLVILSLLGKHSCCWLLGPSPIEMELIRLLSSKNLGLEYLFPMVPIGAKKKLNLGRFWRPFSFYIFYQTFFWGVSGIFDPQPTASTR